MCACADTAMCMCPLWLVLPYKGSSLEPEALQIQYAVPSFSETVCSLALFHLFILV